MYKLSRFPTTELYYNIAILYNITLLLRDTVKYNVINFYPLYVPRLL